MDKGNLAKWSTGVFFQEKRDGNHTVGSSRIEDQISSSIKQNSIHIDNNNVFQNKKANFDLLLLNIQGLNQYKIDKLMSDYCESDLKFLCITETWSLRDDVTNYNIPNYQLISFYGRTNYQRGGVAVWAKSNLNIECLSLNQYCIDKDIEICGLTWNFNSYKNILLVCYRSPNGNLNSFCQNINLLLEKLFQPNVFVFLAGDFNIHSMTVNEVRYFTDILESFGLFPKNSTPTRVTATCASILDINTESDHHNFLLKLNLFSPTTINNHINVRELSENNITTLISHLSKETWKDVYEASDTNTKFKIFHDILI